MKRPSDETSLKGYVPWMFHPLDILFLPCSLHPLGFSEGLDCSSLTFPQIFEGHFDQIFYFQYY